MTPARITPARLKANAARRQKYIARLRERLKGMTSPAQIWAAAYRAGFGACYQGWLRKIRKGDVVLVKERTLDWNAA